MHPVRSIGDCTLKSFPRFDPVLPHQHNAGRAACAVSPLIAKEFASEFFVANTSRRLKRTYVRFWIHVCLDKGPAAEINFGREEKYPAQLRPKIKGSLRCVWLSPASLFNPPSLCLAILTSRSIASSRHVPSWRGICNNLSRILIVPSAQKDDAYVSVPYT